LIAALPTDADILTQVDAALNAAIDELGVGVPSATPSLRTGLMLMYMLTRNSVDVKTTDSPNNLKLTDDAGTVLAHKPLTDDGNDYNEAEMVGGDI
jgi:hypothetical protein